MGSSASSVLKSSRGGGRHGLLLFRSGCIKPYGIGDDESHELFTGRNQPPVFQLLSERINREAREQASQGGVQERAGQGLDAAEVEKHIEPLGQRGGRLLAQMSSIFGVHTNRTDLVDDFDCLHGLTSPSSAPNRIDLAGADQEPQLDQGPGKGNTARNPVSSNPVSVSGNPVSVHLFARNPVSVHLFGQE